ncbi:MAG TPA: GNAT family N-acetyltransferase [Anaerolineae bacterium]|nr:GNAT family N-acetyltransferase [Anaerolineae bacterium]
MVASAARRRAPFSGLRPLDAGRDLAAVADLIAEAFQDDMDPAGERAIRDMRATGRWAFLFGWMDRFAPPGEGMAPGFAWVEDDRIVGNVSVRRGGPLKRGWMIGNVAVAREWRRRGIARALMQAAIDLARRHHGDWVALQVRSDGADARSLYDSLGFAVLGETIHYRRTYLAPVSQPGSLGEDRVRRGAARDGERIYRLAQAAIPEELRWAEPLRRDDFLMGLDRDFANWLSRRREAWWVIESEAEMLGAAHIVIPPPPHEGRLWIGVLPSHQGRYEDHLVHAALSSVENVARSAIFASIPALQTAARAALEAAGFEAHRRLTHMRLTLH